VTDPNLERLKGLLAETQDLTNAATLLFWDERVMMPPSGAPARAEAIADVFHGRQQHLVEDTDGRIRA